MALGRAEDMDGLTPAENDHAPCAILTAKLYQFSGVPVILYARRKFFSIEFFLTFR